MLLPCPALIIKKSGQLTHR